MLYTDMFEKVTAALEEAAEGFYVFNDGNGRKVEVTNMTGGKFLCMDPDGEPVKQTDNASAAYNFLFKAPDSADQHL